MKFIYEPGSSVTVMLKLEVNCGDCLVKVSVCLTEPSEVLWNSVYNVFCSLT